MAIVYNDGTIPFGSRILGLTGSNASGSYIAENFEVTRPTLAVKRLNETGAPAAAVYSEDWVTGNATVQLATTSTTIPMPGWYFQTAVTGSAALEKFVLTQVGLPESNTTDKKVSIQFSKVIN